MCSRLALARKGRKRCLVVVIVDFVRRLTSVSRHVCKLYVGRRVGQNCELYPSRALKSMYRDRGSNDETCIRCLQPAGFRIEPFNYVEKRSV